MDCRSLIFNIPINKMQIIWFQSLMAIKVLMFSGSSKQKGLRHHLSHVNNKQECVEARAQEGGEYQAGGAWRGKGQFCAALI